MTKIYYLAFADEEFQDETVPKSKVMEIANQPEPWCKSRDCKFEYTSDKSKADAILHVLSDANISKQFPTMSGFSVTWFVTPPRIYWNLDNIQHPPKKYTGTKQQYLNYVVNHELGHAIFNIKQHDHEDDRHPITNMCSIMYQQTRGTETCVPGSTYYPGNIL